MLASSIRVKLMHGHAVYSGKVVGPGVSLENDPRDPTASMLTTVMNLQGHPTQVLEGLVKIEVGMYIGARLIDTKRYTSRDVDIRRGPSGHLVRARVKMVDLSEHFPESNYEFLA